MDALDFKRVLSAQKDQVKNYLVNVFPDRAGHITLRFIDGNFRAQGWQGASFKPWKPIKRKGTILVLTGALRRGNYFTTGAGVGVGITKVINNVRYAAVHNNGFNGVVQVPAHKRRIIAATKIGTGRYTKTGKERMKTVHSLKGTGQVKAHSRKVNIAQRQFFPQDQYDSPVLAAAYRREIVQEFQKIFK